MLKRTKKKYSYDIKIILKNELINNNNAFNNQYYNYILL